MFSNQFGAFSIVLRFLDFCLLFSCICNAFQVFVHLCLFPNYHAAPRPRPLLGSSIVVIILLKFLCFSLFDKMRSVSHHWQHRMILADRLWLIGELLSAEIG